MTSVNQSSDLSVCIKTENESWHLVNGNVNNDAVEKLEDAEIPNDSWELVTENKIFQNLGYGESEEKSGKFNKNWQKHFFWLEHNPSNNLTYCKFCLMFPNFSKKVSAFIKGTRIFNLKSVRIHETSRCHASAAQAFYMIDKDQQMFKNNTKLMIDQHNNSRMKSRRGKKRSLNQNFFFKTEPEDLPINVKTEPMPEFSRYKDIHWETDLRPSNNKKRASSCNLRELSDSESPSLYQKYWEQEFPWLQYDSSQRLMFCYVCRKFSSSKSSFVNGTTVFHLNTVRCHAKSQSHHEATKISLMHEKFDCKPEVHEISDDNDDVLICDEEEPSHWSQNCFKKNWLNTFPWLLYDESKNCMYCSFCIKFPYFSTKLSSFINGSSNFQINSLSDHDISESHILAAEAFSKYQLSKVSSNYTIPSGSGYSGKKINERSLSDILDEDLKEDCNSVYKREWGDEFPWVKYNEEENIMYCEYCREFPQFSDKKNNFIKGTNAFKIEVLYMHNMSHGHLEASDAIDNLLLSLQNKHFKTEPVNISVPPVIVEDEDGEWELCEETDIYRPRNAESGPRYKKSWEEQFPWLTFDPDVNLMYCKYCCNFPEFADRRSSFIRGSSQFLKINVRQHNDSKSHTRCYNELLRLNPQSSS